MATIEHNYVGNGSTVLYSFTFPYLREDDVKVTINGTLTTSYTFANATTLQFNTAPANGTAIRIYRSTDDSTLLATFYPGSAIRSQDLNENFIQNLYVTQEATFNADLAADDAEYAITVAEASSATSATALSTANTASSNASAAVTTANAASSTASSAVTTANSAVTTADAAVATANSATATANTALSTANSATTTANTASNTANTAVSTANSAVTTANSAVTTANSAVTTANAAEATADQAAADAQSAVNTANNALSVATSAENTAYSATVTAGDADSKANQAIAAVANALLFQIVGAVANIPGSPANQDAVEVTDSTGIESFTPLTGLPSGFVGDSGLTVRILYDSGVASWTWLQYFPNDPEDRYGDAITALQGDVSTAQGDITTLQADVSTAQGDITTLQADVLGLDSTKLDVTTAASTYAPIDDANLTGATSADAIALRLGLVLLDNDGEKGIALEAPATIGSTISFTLPGDTGSSGQVLQTDGAGVLSWETPDPGITLVDGGNFNNGSSTVNVSQTIDGGQF